MARDWMTMNASRQQGDTEPGKVSPPRARSHVTVIVPGCLRVGTFHLGLSAASASWRMSRAAVVISRSEPASVSKVSKLVKVVSTRTA
jgi:hypothetical protein